MNSDRSLGAGRLQTAGLKPSTFSLRVKHLIHYTTLLFNTRHLVGVSYGSVIMVPTLSA